MDPENYQEHELEGLKIFVSKFFAEQSDTLDISLKKDGPWKYLEVNGISS